MEIRPAKPADLDQLIDIDGTIESNHYLHIERSGEGPLFTWKLDRRPLRTKLIERNAISDDLKFTLKQIVTGADEGMVLVAEHEETPVALAIAQQSPELGTLKVLDLRVDYDHRRAGVATVMLYQIIQAAKDAGLRAVHIETRTSNHPVNQLLQKLLFDVAGLDTHRHSNHDLVKEAATLFWYAALD